MRQSWPRWVLPAPIRKLPSQLTVAENLDVFGRLYGLAARCARHAARSCSRGSASGTCVEGSMAGLSAGQTTRVMLAKAFLARPTVALLDEPTASLDPDIADEVRDFVREQRDEEGVSIVFTSHNMDEVAQICDRVHLPRPRPDRLQRAAR